MAKYCVLREVTGTTITNIDAYPFASACRQPCTLLGDDIELKKGAGAVRLTVKPKPPTREPHDECAEQVTHTYPFSL